MASTLAELFRDGQRIPELDTDDFRDLAELVIEEAARRGATMTYTIDDDPPGVGYVLTFNGEAGETFQKHLDGIRNFTVRVYPEEGEPFDAQFLDAWPGGEEYGDVAVLRCDEHGEPIEDGKPERVRVERIHVF